MDTKQTSTSDPPLPGPGLGSCGAGGCVLRSLSTLPSPFQFSRWWPWGHLRDSGGEPRQDVLSPSLYASLSGPHVTQASSRGRWMDPISPMKLRGSPWRAESSQGFLPLGRCPSLLPMPPGWQLLCGQAPIRVLISELGWWVAGAGHEFFQCWWWLRRETLECNKIREQVGQKLRIVWAQSPGAGGGMLVPGRK